MKKLLTVVAWTLALNFLVLAGAVGWAIKSGRLNDEKIARIKELVMAPATQPATQPAQDVRDPATQPSLKLEQLLAKVSGRPAAEQVEFMQRTFDAQSAQLDRRYREVVDLQKKVDLAQAKLLEDRKALEGSKQKLDTQQQEQNRLLTDKGFQDTLNVYTTIPSKQVKTIFMTLDDATVIQYLRAMEPRIASKIVKEFKSPEETDRISKVMEKMRQAQASVKE